MGIAKKGPRVALAGTSPVATNFRAAATPRIAPFAIFIAFVALQSLLAARETLDAAALQWITLTRGIVVAVALAYFWRSYSELRDPLGDRAHPASSRRLSPAKAKRDWLLAILLGLVVFAAWITFDSGWAISGEPGRGFVPLNRDGSLDAASAALRLFALVAVVPVMEELFWRSFLMRWIDSRDFLSAAPGRASLLAVVLSSALFSLEHSLWFAGLLAGVAYGWLYIRSGNLWVPILSHAITNSALGTWILLTGNWHYW